MKKSIRKFLRRAAGLLPETDLEDLKSKGLKVGKNFKMLQECIIDDSHYWHIEIGDNVTLAPRVHILAHDASTKFHLNYTKIKNVKIGNGVFIGAGSIILPGVSIGENAIVGAGSVVTKDVPAGDVYAGNPAKYICKTVEYIDKQRKAMTPENCFGEDYTLRQDVSLEKKQEMRDLVEKQGIGFVI